MQIRKKGGKKFKTNLLLWNYWANLNIEQFWSFEEISIFSSGGHLGYRTVLTETIMKGDHLTIIQTITGFFMNFEVLPILTDYAN
jgi:hypothetical protein